MIEITMAPFREPTTGRIELPTRYSRAGYSVCDNQILWQGLYAGNYVRIFVFNPDYMGTLRHRLAEQFINLMWEQDDESTVLD
jgi:hypothetical protein